MYRLCYTSSPSGLINEIKVKISKYLDSFVARHTNNIVSIILPYYIVNYEIEFWPQMQNLVFYIHFNTVWCFRMYDVIGDYKIRNKMLQRLRIIAIFVNSKSFIHASAYAVFYSCKLYVFIKNKTVWLLWSQWQIVPHLEDASCFQQMFL